jgi:DNA polymerase-3 subunit epsilon
LIATEGQVGQSATVHGLTDDALAEGMPLVDAVAEVLRAMSGRVLLAHFARIERDFLRIACERAWGSAMPTVIVDTMELHRRLLSRQWGAEIPDGGLRLWTARTRYGLPVYRAHEALTDALACAELYLAQTAEIAAERTVTLGAISS